MGGDDLIFDTNSAGTLSENGNAIGIPAKETNIFTNPSDNPIIQVNRVASVIKKKLKKTAEMEITSAPSIGRAGRSYREPHHPRYSKNLSNESRNR